MLRLILWRRKWRLRVCSHQGQKLTFQLCLQVGAFLHFPMGCFSPGVSILTLPVWVLHFPCCGYGNSCLYFKIMGLEGHLFLLIPFKMNWFAFIRPFIHFFTRPYSSPFTCSQTAKIGRYSQSSLFMDSVFINLTTC